MTQQELTQELLDDFVKFAIKNKSERLAEQSYRATIDKPIPQSEYDSVAEYNAYEALLIEYTLRVRESQDKTQQLMGEYATQEKLLASLLPADIKIRSGKYYVLRASNSTIIQILLAKNCSDIFAAGASE